MYISSVITLLICIAAAIAVRFFTKDTDTRKCIFVFDLLMNRSRFAKHIEGPEFVGKAQLTGFKLTFGIYSKVHSGCVASLTAVHSASVWGIVWEIHAEQVAYLDEVRGVWLGISRKIEAEIRLHVGNDIEPRRCIVYYNRVKPLHGGRAAAKAASTSIVSLPPERAPSGAYMKELFTLANENGLAFEYIDYLSVVPHNGKFLPEVLIPNPIFAAEFERFANDASHLNVKVGVIVLGLIVNKFC